MFKNIFKLQAGHHASFRKDELNISTYWDLTFPNANASFPKSEDDARGRDTRSV